LNYNKKSLLSLIGGIFILQNICKLKKRISNKERF
jgi:hypothetical protein